ncbi:hypothetical protein AGMMS4952_23370 [Spirochaetia bacterium]|nr:hypothetical protein AGMMS4952_23370 [Spirochaetia bacterium]
MGESSLIPTLACLGVFFKLANTLIGEEYNAPHCRTKPYSF